MKRKDSHPERIPSHFPVIILFGLEFAGLKFLSCFLKVLLFFTMTPKPPHLVHGLKLSSFSGSLSFPLHTEQNSMSYLSELNPFFIPSVSFFFSCHLCDFTVHMNPWLFFLSGMDYFDGISFHQIPQTAPLTEKQTVTVSD